MLDGVTVQQDVAVSNSLDVTNLVHCNLAVFSSFLDQFAGIRVVLDFCQGVVQVNFDKFNFGVLGLSQQGVLQC